MLATNHADPKEQLAGLPVMLRELCENIFGRLSEHDPEEGKGFLSDILEAVADCERKDLSRVAWAFLAAELRDMPKQSEGIQHDIDAVIKSMDLLASGADWPDATYAPGPAAYAAAAAALSVADCRPRAAQCQAHLLLSQIKAA